MWGRRAAALVLRCGGGALLGRGGCRAGGAREAESERGREGRRACGWGVCVNVSEFTYARAVSREPCVAVHVGCVVCVREGRCAASLHSAAVPTCCLLSCDL